MSVAFVGLTAVAGAGIERLRTRALIRRLAVAEHAATTDPLTGLANRTGLRREFERLRARADVRRRQVVLILLTWMASSRSTTTFGHGTGDRVLVEVADRLTRFRPHGRSVLAARLGGDEFVVVFPAESAWAVDSTGTELIQQVRAAIAAVSSGTHIVFPSASVGLAYESACGATLGAARRRGFSHVPGETLRVPSLRDQAIGCMEARAIAASLIAGAELETPGDARATGLTAARPSEEKDDHDARACWMFLADPNGTVISAQDLAEGIVVLDCTGTDPDPSGELDRQRCSLGCAAESSSAVVADSGCRALRDPPSK
ncbi:MAG: GGDEF domain-containing protein [Dehalococcoidia bacterium]